MSTYALQVLPRSLTRSFRWKQLLNRTDVRHLDALPGLLAQSVVLQGLREAWEARKQAVLAATGKGGDDYMVEALRKQAESNIGASDAPSLVMEPVADLLGHSDSIHASKLQLSEVQAGWRHSTDPASCADPTALPDRPR